MAPWPDRVDSHRPIDRSPPRQRQQTATHNRDRRPYPGSIGRRFQNPTQTDELEALHNLNLQGDDSSSSDEDLHPSSQPQRPGHTRSMSHPFPSLFSIKKKKSSNMPKKSSDSDPDEAPPVPDPSRPQTRGHRTGSSVGNKDFSTGNCMTCGSLVRWPKELYVFKCTICLTINDLRSRLRDQKGGNGERSSSTPEDRSKASGKRLPSLAGNTLSLELTKTIATQCLRSFLISELGTRSGKVPPERRGSNMGISQPTRGYSGSDARPSRLSPNATRSLRPQPQSSRQESYLTSNRPPNTRSLSTSYPERRPVLRDLVPQPAGAQQTQTGSQAGEPRRIFKSLEDYVVACFTSFECLNSAFTTHRPSHRGKQSHDGGRRRPPEPRRELQNPEHPIIDLDAKLLLLGDFAENGSWWSGGQEDLVPGRSASNRSETGHSAVSMRTPYLDWDELGDWYTTVIEAGRSWPAIYDELVDQDPGLAVTFAALEEIEAQIIVGQEHLQRTLLKASETILKRPGRPIANPHDLRFLLIVAANPLLRAGYEPWSGEFDHPDTLLPGRNDDTSRGTGPVSGQHSGLIKRIVGIMSNTPTECHNHLVAWLARYPQSIYVQMKDLAAGFLAYRLIRQNEKKYEARVDVMDGLIPSMRAGRSPASLHAALERAPGSSKKQKEKQQPLVYHDDWQIKAAAQVLGLLFAANSTGYTRGNLANRSNCYATAEGAQNSGQALPTSDFYMTLLDESDLVGDFEAWERTKAKFSFCQYPFLLSIGAKIRILEHDARRQMENKARDAFFDSIMTHRVVQQFLILNIRRDCLVDDSLRAVREVIGGGGEEIKKGLKIVFKGEEGVDAGGLRKEWFLLLVREVFNPDHGMFIYDEDSQYCYFNPNSLEPSEQFFLVGVVFGLAIYNSTILDVALPPFAFRKLLLAAPPPAIANSQPRQTMTYTLDDLAEYRPRLARGLRQLLDYEGDVESIFGLDFVIDTDRYGSTERVVLCPGGEKRAVTNANRREYVDLYVRYLLDTSVSRQFEPFKRGFFTVCGGNALSLFRPDEIELLVRGSDGALDVESLKAVAEYDNWRSSPNPAETEPIIRWFWDTFESASAEDQRKLLLFITGSDRIPAMGAASLTIRISCLGEDCGRYPTARTCFNTLSLWRYPTRRRLEELLWRAVYESEGFGLK
ncbi:putative E3 ubiquitin-protein ligase [Rhypophila decipiens]